MKMFKVQGSKFKVQSSRLGKESSMLHALCSMLLLLLLLSAALPGTADAREIYYRAAATGNTSNSMDNISTTTPGGDGHLLADGDVCNILNGQLYVYLMVAASGATPDPPYVVEPATSPGNMRWIWQLPAGITYPAAGVAVSPGTGGPWSASLTVGIAANNLVQLDAYNRLPAVSGANLTGLNFQAAYSILSTLDNLANGAGWLYNNGSGGLSYSTPSSVAYATSAGSASSASYATSTGSAGSLNAASALPNGTTATTPCFGQSGAPCYNGVDFSTKIATTYWVQQWTAATYQALGGGDGDYADYQPLAKSANQVPNIVYGKVYCDTDQGAQICTSRAQIAVMGIASDIHGQVVGLDRKEGGVPLAVAGWVLAYCDRQYPIGTVLTNDASGNLTVMTDAEKAAYPERIVATYQRPEPLQYSSVRNKEGVHVLVDGRAWVRVK